MSVWRPIDQTNIGQIVNNGRHLFEVFRAPDGRFWYRDRTPQEAAELRVLWIELAPDEQRLNDALRIAPP